MRIGNLILDNNVALAPMAVVTDLSFRLLCKEQGCGYVVSEMVSAKAILYNNKNTDSAGGNPAFWLRSGYNG